MSAAIRIALVGFTSFEHHTFESYFRLAEQSEPHYQLTDHITECRLAVVNADDDHAYADIVRHAKLGVSLMLGNTPREGAVEQLPRPIDLNMVVRALDDLVARTPPLSRAVQRVLDDLVIVTQTLGGEINPRELAARHAAGPVPGPERRHLERERHRGKGPARPELDHILVVDRGDSVMRFMVQHLERFGFQLHRVCSAAEAIEKAARRHHEFVFVDASLADPRGLGTCLAIKQHSCASAQPPPTVVVLVRQHTAVIDLPDASAGCDDYLLRPLQQGALLKLVGDREVTKTAFASTAHTASTRV